MIIMNEYHYVQNHFLRRFYCIFRVHGAEAEEANMGRQAKSRLSSLLLYIAGLLSGHLIITFYHQLPATESKGKQTPKPFFFKFSTRPTL